MEKTFDKKILFDNIYYLSKKNNHKLNDLEKYANVSNGYITRTSKDDNPNPSLDFVMRISDALEIDIDLLLNYRLEEMDATRFYIISFISKLINDTKNGKLDWKVETAEYLNNELPKEDRIVPHPLFIESELSKEDGDKKLIFPSDSFGTDTLISTDCYNAKLSELSTIYVMNVKKANKIKSATMEMSEEIWIKHLAGSNLLCNTKNNYYIRDEIHKLNIAIGKYVDTPKINIKIKSVIDDYMKK